MATYSFIMEFKGSTCTSQHQAENIVAACKAWKEYICTGAMPGLNVVEFREDFDGYLQDMPPVAIDTFTNFWGWGWAFGGPKKSQMQTFELYIIRMDPVMEVVSEPVVEELSSI